MNIKQQQYIPLFTCAYKGSMSGLGSVEVDTDEVGSSADEA